jgi:zona occludens toxin (predicted ATPase)
MIYAVFGMPGSGKSYYVVNEFIVKRIATNTIISNIQLSDDVEVSENYRYLEKKDMDNLHNNIRKIMESLLTSHDDKKEQLSFLFSIYGSGDITMIVDECHLYGYRGRSSSISYIDDFLSIHRHIFTDRKFDVVLITQVPSRLNTEIAAQVEVAVKAIPASQRLIPSLLEYTVFGSVDALKKNDKDLRLKRQIIKGDPKVFELYQSGFVLKGSNDFRKKLGFISAGVVLVIVFMVFQFKGLVSGGKLPHAQPIAENKIKHDSNTTDNNSTFTVVEKPYKIICRVVPKDFNSEKVKNWFYDLYFSDNLKQLCYRRYLNV